MALDERVFKRRRRRHPKRNIGSSADATLSEDHSSSLFRFLSEDTEIRIQPFEEIPEQEQEEPPPPNDNNHSMPQLSLLALLAERGLAGMAVQLGTRTIRQRQAKQRTIKFTELGTSASTAVLGLDRTGSFLLALAAAASSEDEEDDSNNNNALVLQMFGLPSPAVLSRPGHRGPTLLLQIPLPYDTAVVDNIEGEESNWFSQPSPVQTAVRIWLADDERLGICMYRDTAAMSTGSSPAHVKQPVQVVLFRQPRTHQNASSSPSAVWRLRNVHAPSQMQQDSNLFRDSNLLWKVDCFPTTTDEHRSGKPGQQLAPTKPSSSPSWWLCGSAVQGLPAYLFLIDEEDGFRLTWIRDTAWNERELLHRYSVVASLWKDERSDGDGEMNNSGDTKRKETVVRSTSHTHIVVPVSRGDAGWERCAATTTAANHQSSSAMAQDNNIIPPLAGGGFSIAFTGFFSATALLHSILTRRPSLVRPRFDSSCAKVPNYSYHLVGVYRGGRTAEVLILFSVGPAGGGCIGVFVTVDLFTSDYREDEFIRHSAYDTPPLSCASLALERRRLRCQPRDRSSGKLVDGGSGGRVSSMLASLYPDCETIDNVAVRRQQPVLSMKATDAAVEIVYG